MAGSSKKAIYAALAGNSLIAITKFAAAAYSGSSAMFSEGIHSLVDTGNQILLLHGLKRAEKPANAEFPLGHGKEIYFWSFVVAILIFALGGGISIYQGWQHLSHPEPMQNILVNYLVLGAAIVFEAGALWVAFREFNASRGDRGLFEAVRGGKDPSLFVVVFEDTAALLGLLIALAGLALFQLTGNMIFDGLASIGIGVVLVVTATWLAYESKGLLIGEAADPRIVARIREILAAQEYIANTNEVTTVHMGPSQIIVMLSVDFIDGLDSSVVESTVTRINHRIKAIDPAIRRVFVEVERAADHGR
jgi:cation diffusion facilitator family transporter